MEVHAIIDRLYKKNFAKMVIVLAKYAGFQDLATAEDIVQEAFMEATRTWAHEVPKHPEAWLYRVCRNLAYKSFRDGKARMQTSLYESENTLKYQVDNLFKEDEEDDQLKMLYSSVHPQFAPKSQVIFALRYVAGFRIAQIALVLGSEEEAVTKALQRMRDLIARERLTFQASSLGQLSSRTPIVLKVIYLMFNEGYKSSQGNSMLNYELCEDALSLAQSIVKRPSLACPEAEGLLALILFNLSRFEARFNANGKLVDLENQDRMLWNQDLIRVAKHHLNLAKGASYGTWHLEAAIAFKHASARTFETTDWIGIASLYDRIVNTNDSPFTRLNQAVAIFYAGDTTRSMQIMTRLGESAVMQGYHLYHVAMGKFLCRMDEKEKAMHHLEKARTLTTHQVEKDFITNLMESC